MDNTAILLSAYADGELDATTTAQAEALIASDPAARRMVELHRETRALLRAAMPEALFAPDNAQFAVQTGTATRRRFALSAAVAAVVIGCVGFTGGAYWATPVPDARAHLLDEVAEYHDIFSKETTHLVEVPASRTDEIKAWLGPRIGRDIAIPDLTPAGLRFAGARMLVIDSAPVANLIYTRDDGPPVALCILAHTGKPSEVRIDRHGTLLLAHWNDDTHVFVIAAEADAASMKRFANYARAPL